MLLQVIEGIKDLSEVPSSIVGAYYNEQDNTWTILIDKEKNGKD